jgi:transposase-like protein
MKMEAISFEEWQKRFSEEDACIAHLIEARWPKGYVCSQCQSTQHYYIAGHHRFECRDCGHTLGVKVGTVFENSKLPLTKWFTAILLMSSDKGGISAQRLSKVVNVDWNTARLMLSKLRTVMGDRNREYQLAGTVEFDDALVGGVSTGGKRGRGAEKKTPVLVACENEGAHAGFVAMKAVPSVDGDEVKAFAQEAIQPGKEVRTDGLAALNTLGEKHNHQAKVTPSKEAKIWLPWVHTAIALLKRFLLGTFHGVSGKYLQEYLDEFCYRFNRRAWEGEIPVRLLSLCVAHPPI